MFMRTWAVCRCLRLRTSGSFLRLRQYSTTKTHYEVLGVPTYATPEEIQNAFLEKSKKYHPDINKDPSAKEKFVEMCESYAVLSKESTRTEYDYILEAESRSYNPPDEDGYVHPTLDERVAAEREKWKRFHNSPDKSFWQFQAESENWEGRSQYEKDKTKSKLTKTQLRLVALFMVVMALSINLGGLYDVAKLKAKKDAEKAAIANALKELEEAEKQRREADTRAF